MMRAVDDGHERDGPSEDNPPAQAVPPVASVRATGFFDDEYVNGRRVTTTEDDDPVQGRPRSLTPFMAESPPAEEAPSGHPHSDI